MNWIVLLFGLSLSVLAQASETPFEQHYRTEILPYYEAAPSGYLTGVDGAQLFYKKFEVPNEKAAIVFVTGWTETSLKYAEFIYELTQKGYSVYSMDHRGMGFSSRLTSNPQQIHVENFDDYVLDLNQFIEVVVERKAHSKLFMVSHSMGGLVAARYLALFPANHLSAAVFNSPMFQIQTGSIPLWTAYDIASVSVTFGLAKSYILGSADTTYEKSSDFTKETTTHSLPRWLNKISNWKKYPSLLQSGSTNQWLKTTLESTSWLAQDGLKNLSLPILVFQAGLDTYVLNDSETSVCAQVKDCTFFATAGAYHETFLELDEYRQPVMDKMFQFLDTH